MRSYWIKVGSEFNAWCSYMKRRGHRRRREDHVKMEADTGVLLSQSRPLKATRSWKGKEGSPQSLWKELGPADTLISDFWPPEP